MKNLSPSNNNASFACSAVATLLCGMLLSGLPGCGRNDRPTTIRVQGTVTFDGELPEYPGAIYFAPTEVAEGYPRRGGRAIFETDGKFSATSFEEGDGLVPGKYVVRLECWKVPPAMGKPGVSYLPKGFEAPELIVAETERMVRYDLNVLPPAR